MCRSVMLRYPSTSPVRNLPNPICGSTNRQIVLSPHQCYFARNYSASSSASGHIPFHSDIPAPYKRFSNNGLRQFFLKSRTEQKNSCSDLENELDLAFPQAVTSYKSEIYVNLRCPALIKHICKQCVFLVARSNQRFTSFAPLHGQNLHACKHSA